MIALLLACTGTGTPADSGFTPDTWAELQDAPEPQVLLDGLSDPRGLAVLDEGLLVVEGGSGSLLLLGATGELDTVAADLPEGRWVETDGSLAVVVGTEAAWTVDLASGTVTELAVLSAGGPAALAPDGRVALVDEAGLWLGDTEGVSLALALSGATDVAWHDAEVLVARRDAREITVADGVTGEQLDAIPLDDGPVALAVRDDTLTVTARATRWPYAGWVLTGTPDDLQLLSTTPPEPARLAVGTTEVFWASKQSVASVSREGGTYTIVGARTAVADLVLWDELPVWTDDERGLVLTTP